MTDVVIAHCMLRPDRPGADEDARRELEALGFDVLRADRASLVFRAPRRRFEEVFDTTLEPQPMETMPGKGIGAETVHYRSARPIAIPAQLSDVVAEVSLPPPPQFHV